MNKLFWGFFFLYLDFDLNFGASTLELLPEWLGFVLLYLACGELLGESDLFQKPRPFCVGLSIYSAIIWVLDFAGFDTEAGVLSWILSIAFSVLTLYVGYLVIEAFRNVEMRRNYDLCSVHLRKVWLVLAVTTAAGYVLLLLLPTLALVCAIAAGIAGIVFLVAVHGTRKAWHNMMDEQSRPL